MFMKAILFDHDGVLADSESVFFSTTRESFERAGVELTEDTWGELYLGGTIRTKDVALKLGIPENEIPDLVDQRNRIYRQRLRQGVPFLDGVQALIESLRTRTRMAIVTGCPRRNLEAIHAAGDFLGKFDCIVTADDCVHTKPDPEPYRKAVQQLGMDPQDCLAVEDSPRGIDSATAAGVRTVLITTPLTRLDLCRRAWKICSDIPAAQRVIEGWLTD